MYFQDCRLENSAPDSSDSNFETLWIRQKSMEKAKQASQMFLESFNISLQNREKNERANFALGNQLGCARLLQEREEGRPSVFRDLNRGYRRYHTRSWVADEIANKK